MASGKALAYTGPSLGTSSWIGAAWSFPRMNLSSQGITRETLPPGWKLVDGADEIAVRLLLTLFGVNRRVVLHLLRAGTPK